MSTTNVKRAFKYRFYPNGAQAAELSRTFGCARKVYNLALNARTEAWKKRAHYPRFKSKKRSRASVEYTSSGFRFHNGELTLAKMTKPLEIVWSRPLPPNAQPSKVTVSRDAAGRWFVSILCRDPALRPFPSTSAAIGVDVGLNHLLTLSTGEKMANPRHERRDRDRLARAQRNLARKAKGGGTNRAKAGKKVARVYARISDRRHDHLHKLTTRLVRENQTIVIEDLTVRNMLESRSLSRAISDAAWSRFRRLLEYKAAWYGREFIAVDRWFPSSKLCSSCGALQVKMPLSTRAWTCDCGSIHDRDVNAAKNILAARLAVSACGADVRPQRITPGGYSATKQESPQREL